MHPEMFFAFVVLSAAVVVRSSAFQTGHSLRFRKERDEEIAFLPKQVHDATPIRFPGSSRSTFRPEPLTDNTDNTSSQIPVSLFLTKNINSPEDFLNTLVLKGNEAEPKLTEARKNNASILLRSNSDSVISTGIASLAACEPRMSVVPIEKPTDPATLYFPSCTNVERCGGCCMHDLLSCQPSEMEKIDIQVLKMRYRPESEGFVPEGYVTLPLEKHNKCECRCRIHEEDCNPSQHYRPNECRCICNNEHESQECRGENKFWNPVTCTCACRNTHPCSTGFFFDEITCSCQPERSNSPNIVFRLPSPGFRGNPYDIIREIKPSPRPVPTFRRLKRAAP